LFIYIEGVIDQNCDKVKGKAMSSIPKGLIHMRQTTALTDLHGQIERLTYFDEESGYTIAKVKINGNKDLVTGPASAR
jgi:hypothetical protein